MNDTLKGLTNPEFVIAGATFRVSKLKGVAGFDMLELIRTAMAGGSNTLSGAGMSEEEAGSKIMGLLFSIDPSKVREIREIVFQNLDVKLPAADRFLELGKVEAAVIDLIEPVDIYEIIARFIAVNFTKSIVGMMNRLGLQQVDQ